MHFDLLLPVGQNMIFEGWFFKRKKKKKEKKKRKEKKIPAFAW